LDPTIGRKEAAQMGSKVTNTSINPARSTSQAIFVGGWALSQLWLFWIAPILGAILAGFVYRNLFDEKKP
jgi:aquaporin Z